LRLRCTLLATRRSDAPLGSRRRRKISRRSPNLVDQLARVRPRSPDLLRLLPHRSSVRAGTSAPPKSSRHRLSQRERRQASRKRYPPRHSPERNAALLQRRKNRPPQDRTIPRYRIHSKRADPLLLRKQQRATLRSARASLPQHVGRATKIRPGQRRLALAEF